MSHVTVQITSKKNLFKNMLKKLTSKPAAHSEKDPLLSKNRLKKESVSFKKIKEDVKLGFQDLVKPKKRKDDISEESSEQVKSTEKNIWSLITKMQYDNECLLIYDLEHNGTEDGSGLHREIAEEMWGTVSQAMKGDHNQNVKLQTISDCIKWANQQKGNKGPNWVPQAWQKELEILFEKDIIEHIPMFVHKTDEGGLKNHLLELERNISEIIDRIHQFPVDLSVTCLKCLHVCILNHLTSLADKKLKYEEHVLLYKWTNKEHTRLCTLCISKYRSEDFDYMLFGKCLFDIGLKIASTGRERIHKELLEILQSEIVWNSNPRREVRYYFHDISKEEVNICQAVEDLGKSLVSMLKSSIWEEFSNFVTRYETFLKDKVDGMVSGNGIIMGLRIVKNSIILRNTLENVGTIPQDLVIQNIIGQCEDKGTDLVLSALKPTMKEAFQNYFKKNCIEYKNVLRQFQCTLINEDIQSNKMFISHIYHVLVVLYLQSFFKYSNILSHVNKGEMFSNASKKLAEFFSNLVSDKDLLSNNPLDFITKMLTATDHESLRTTTFFFVNKHHDLRKEHLMAILNIKGNVSREEKEDLSYYLQNRKENQEVSTLHFFEDVQVGNNKWNCFLCCPCLASLAEVCPLE